MIDPIWAGVVGGAVGGGFTTLATILGARNERKGRLDELDKTRDIAEDKARREYKQKLVTDWRRGLAEVTASYLIWDRKSRKLEPAGDEPMLFGQTWFESLRPHLTRSQTPVPGRDDTISSIYEPTDDEELSTEIARIEREWGLI